MKITLGYAQLDLLTYQNDQLTNTHQLMNEDVNYLCTTMPSY